MFRNLLFMTKRDTTCPCCEKDLRKHHNEELQKCAFRELSKINQMTGDVNNV